MSKSTNKEVKALYIMVFSLIKRGEEQLQEITRAAGGMLKGKDATFKQLYEEQMAPKTRINISNVQYLPFGNTFEWRQTLFIGWLEKQVTNLYPMSRNNLFMHGMKNQEGEELFFYFYFDMMESQAETVVQQETVNTFQEQTKPETPASKGRPKWVIIAAVVGAIVLCTCAAITILPVIFFGGS